MKKTNKLISILLAVVMLLTMAPLSLTASASANDKVFIGNSTFILLKGNAATIEAGSKANFTKIKIGNEYIDFSQCKYSSGEAMFTLGDSNYEADLSGTDICGAQYNSMTGDVNITMTGGVVGNISGSCSDPGTVLTGNVNITMTGGKVTEIWCAEYDVNGNVNITITGGTVDKFIYLIYRSDVTISGDCWVTITGGSPGTLNRYGGTGDKIQGSTHLYSTTLPYGYDRNNFTNFVYRDGSNWKFGGNTATALNGNTLTIASGQTATVDSGKTLSGTIVNNGTINVKNGGTLSGTVTNNGTIWGYGNISGVTNSGSGKTIKKVTASGTNVTFNDSAWQNNKTNYDDAYNATLTAASGYALPASVTVKVGGTTLAESAYTYNASTGALSIPSAKITTDTTVSASAPINLSDSANSITLEKAEYTYTGSAITPALMVNGVKANANDYTAEYSDNTNVGTATVSVTGKNSYTGSKVLTFKILPANISEATVTLGDSLTYNGATQTQTVKSVTVNGITLTEGIDYTISGNTGMNVGNYTLKITGINNAIGEITNDWEISRLPITVTATDMSKTYGEADPTLAYTLSNEAFASEIVGELARTSGENVGVYEIGQGTLTNDNNPNFEITFAGGLFTIEPDKSGIEGLTVDNVKSIDKENVEYVYNQLENAVKDLADEDKISEWNTLQAHCGAMHQRIEIVENGLAGYKAKTAEYNIDTVTSDDADKLESFDYEVGQFYFEHRNNLTEEETKEFDNILSKITALRNRISDVADEIARIESAMNIYDTETVKSSDKADIEQLVADIKVLTDGQNITADERAKLGNLDATADTLLAKIAETTAEYDRVIAAANGYDEATVTSADKDALVQFNDDIYALALTDNVTEEEKENLENAHNKVLGLIDKLTAISDEIKRIIEAVDKYVFESVKSSDKADIEQLIDDIKALLDTKNITADERALLENADETCTKLIAKIDETVAEINRINDATNTYDEATVKYSDYKDILQLIDGIKALTDGQNITDDERASLEELNTKANLLAAKIRSTADEISRITRAVNAYNIDTVKSSDKADIENLIARIKKLTDGDNITFDERTNLNELDSTLDALLAKIDDTAAEIARIDEAVNGYDKDTVTSDDVPELGKLIDDIKALTDSDNLTEDERAALEANDEAVDALVEKLAEVAEEIKRVDEAVKSYDEDSVKSTDKEDLVQLKEDVQALIDSKNTTQNEKTALEEMIQDIEGLENRIEEIEKQLEDISDFEESFNPETVTSDDKAAIEDKIAEIEAVNPDNLTDEQKAEYDEIKAGLEALLEEIAAAGAEVEAVSTELEMFDEKRVTIFWEEDIEAFKAKIDELLADENMGETEKAKLNEYKAQAEKLIEIINTPKEYFSLRFFYFIWDCLNWKWDGIVYLFKLIFAC
ncbi:MAG: hypothetical protein IKK63_00320 [Clostridia bacterium]|nr:hypothetical protein [Clostridia bacterium]